MTLIFLNKQQVIKISKKGGDGKVEIEAPAFGGGGVEGTIRI